uniref:Queuine tRNA-ribosyltransferase accessory subunit 2 n=1 Tax=Elaeis guineensis var. tenera TaxID=51953 RepID=A0A8N4EV24_ELAGV|nr:queuine tRNA-ribosyltransferase accessory subunit 2 isoform X2 [Elaeis guineensis]
MRFVVTKACGGGGRARAGSLYVGCCPTPIETPCLLLSTRKGLPTFVSPDLLASLPSPESRLLHVSPLHFLECPSPRTISNIGGLHRMLGLHECIFVAAPRDSIESLPESEGTNKLGPSFETPCGRRLVKPKEYMDMISSLKPNLWASLADEVPAWVSEKRNKTSVDRTLRWLDDCLALDLESGANTLGAIVGGSCVEERKRCATEVAMRNVSGLEALDLERVWKSALLCLMQLRMAYRRKSFARYLDSLFQGVAAGIDLFESTYIYHLTLGGFALTFPLDIVERDILHSQLSDTGSDCTKINLRATVYRKDTTPIVENCSCFTCQNHTRAYINHLLNVHEMLAQILLEIHNTHHYLAFFHSIRKAIKGGKFDLFHQRFMEGRRAYVTSAVGCS